MPRPKRPGAPEPKKRSRNGCWPCKARKVKCGEERPICVNCERTGETCDYSIKLNWEGRKKKNPGFETILFQVPSESSSSSQQDARCTSVVSSIATTSRMTEGQSPSMSSFRAGEQETIPGSEPARASSSGTSSKGSLPGMNVFGGRSRGHARDNSVEIPVCSPDFSGPIPLLPQPHISTFNAVSGPYAPASENSIDGIGRPPPLKRLKYSVDLDVPPQISSPTESTSAGATPRLFPSITSTGLATATTASSPLTPAASSPYSDGGRQTSSSHGMLGSPDVRKMSVNSLLSGPPGPVARQYAPPSERAVNARTTLCLSQVTTYYGVDPGFKDLDLGQNDDAHAIIKSFRDSTAEDDMRAAESIRTEDKSATRRQGYYNRPMPVRIPQDLEPLPSKLRDNPMNLLYFHHFMNHTAKALVPHDDEQSNPYRHVLPQMAVQNDNLLSLMLAYSASHRAHLLNQPEPATRIAHWVQDIFPALRAALNDPNQKISNANIATGIMLASLEIVSPTAFGYTIPWQRHLGLARELIASRPDGIRWSRRWTQEDQVRAFLWSWLAYLDVLGTLSGGRRESSTAWILDYQKDDYEEEFDEIDCLMGMTTRGVYILAKVAELAKECDALRAHGGGGGTIAAPAHAAVVVDLPHAPGVLGREWQPPKDIITRAWELEDEAKRSMILPPQPCKHLHASGDVVRWEQREMTALNEAFHWAGLVHLHRRVLGKPSGHEDVQAAVLKIHACIDCVPLGGSAEASLLFPLFTAACETLADEERRARVRERLGSMARSGFLQVARAKVLVEKVWESGRPWDEMVTTEFIG
ncbi:hypothetical protein N8I77_003989 [Diaporthe amygdali]|uniref:Zn(2)-C6 fungal-type domain-containing protein n=1 Tax=Phomopsis amygdali TaxID=1214568 RepID=A0AAD9W875_PHOAM|nr:hypothetical protein N8I77_003989 [Diaporthe amygdali]